MQILHITNNYPTSKNPIFGIFVKDDKPIGDKWSFDEENRKRVPKNYQSPSSPLFESKHYDDIQKIHELKTGKLIQVAMTMPHLGIEQQSNQLIALDQIGKDLGLTFQIMDDVLEASSDSNTLGKSNQSDLLNKKLTYVNVFGKQDSVNQAKTLSNACIEKLESSFNKQEAADLIELAKFMVTRKS